MAGDVNVLCSVCRLPIIDDGNGNEDPGLSTRMHRKCMARQGDLISDGNIAVALAIRAKKAIVNSGIPEAINAWSSALAPVPDGSFCTSEQLRETVQRVIVSLLLKSKPQHAALLRELEELFGKFPETRRVAS